MRHRILALAAPAALAAALLGVAWPGASAPPAARGFEPAAGRVELCRTKPPDPPKPSDDKKPKPKSVEPLPFDWMLG